MVDFAVLRKTMLDNQIRTVDVTDPTVLAAFGSVPRELFVPAADRPFAYLDRPVEVAPGRVVPQPAVLARLVQFARPKRNEKVLLIGGTTGYTAAVLAALAGSVTMVESDAGLAAGATATLADLANVTVVCGPLAAGRPEAAPFDLILIDGGVEEIPAALIGQLAEGGRLIAVLGTGLSARATITEVGPAGAATRAAFSLPGVPLAAFAKPRVFAL
jgi:protein-L-isoaspartate(D-aspartate) O-methyltransferase